VYVARRDAADPAHNHVLAAWLHDHLPAVQVYGHAAGLLGFDLLPDLTADTFGAVIKPKASLQISMRCWHLYPPQSCCLQGCFPAESPSLHASLSHAHVPQLPVSQVVGASALADYQLPCLATALFSSTASVWSQAGAGHYSASNCYLDGLAQALQAAGRPATAVNFGPFADTGMAASLRCERVMMENGNCKASALQAAF